LTERGLEEGGWTAAPAGWLIETREPFTDAQLAAARAMAADAGLTVETRDEQGGLGTVRSVASAVGVLLALGILAMTVGLIRGESARELRTLTATGAASHTRRALTASTAGALALLGVILAITTTYLALVAGYWPDAGRLTRIPVAHLTAIAVGLPLIATGASWLLAGREQPGVSRAAIE
jgi:putative ABC transport system permease protein